MKLSKPVIENYLKTIYAHTEWQGDAITPSVLAERLGLAPSTVTEMVKKLAASGLVTHVRYGAITLTDAGRAEAVAVVRRHRLTETWLVREMGYSWDEVHDEAEVLEHAISDRLLESIDARLGYPDRDPHGDPIPASDGSVRREAAIVVGAAEPGHVGVVLRISDRDPELLRSLEASGIDIGTTVSVAGGAVIAGDATVPLTDEAASAIWISA
ncbi:metal-dependent transcriptional regulator [Mycetocola zhadangensis]|uniref:metal-dependent transcriptional regulator n=1 Tax=Mycetocola zhadangensis TaxID=1164595 RepID=UPI003A4E1728